MGLFVGKKGDPHSYPECTFACTVNLLKIK